MRSSSSSARMRKLRWLLSNKLDTTGVGLRSGPAPCTCMRLCIGQLLQRPCRTSMSQPARSLSKHHCHAHGCMQPRLLSELLTRDCTRHEAPLQCLWQLASLCPSAQSHVECIKGHGQYRHTTGAQAAHSVQVNLSCQQTAAWHICRRCWHPAAHGLM